MKSKLSLILGLAMLATLQPALSIAQNLSPAAGPTTLPNSQRPDGFIMSGGRTYVVSRGVATPLTQEMTLRITPTAIIGFDDLPRTITNNTMLTLDGRIVTAPTGLTLQPGTLTPIDPRLADRGVYGNNVSGLAPSPGIRPAVGPRNIIAKKSSVTKSRTSAGISARKSTPSIAAKKPVVAKPKVIAFPPFQDEVLRLPDQPLPENDTTRPVIDATSTMLYMTKVPEAPAPAPVETASLGASLGLFVNPGDELKMPTPFAPAPPLPAPALTVPPILPTPAFTPANSSDKSVQ